MLYVCFGTFVRGIIVNAILLVPAGVLFALLNLFGIPFSILGTTIFIGIIFLLILGFLVIMMWPGGGGTVKKIVFGVNAPYISEYDIEKFENKEVYQICGNKKIVGYLVKGKPVYAVFPYIFLFVHLIISVACGVALSFVFRGTINIDADVNLIIALVTTGTTLWQFTYFIVKFIFYIKSTCFKCGKIFCKVETSKDNLAFNSGIGKRTKKTSNKVGDIYSEGKRIGGIYQNSYDTYKVHNYYRKDRIHCKCLYCSKTSRVVETDVSSYIIED